jgi:hypothetical protein
MSPNSRKIRLSKARVSLVASAAALAGRRGRSARRRGRGVAERQGMRLAHALDGRVLADSAEIFLLISIGQPIKAIGLFPSFGASDDGSEDESDG